MNYLIRSILLLLLTILLGSNKAFSAAPATPVEFTAKAVSGTTAVYLSWIAKNEGDAATSFNIYMYKGESRDTDDFDLYKTVNSQDYREKDKHGNQIYKVEISRLEAGVYSFYVTAVNDDGESEASIVKVLQVYGNNNSDKPKVISEPKGVVFVGDEYEYRVKISPHDAQAVYSLASAPDGMEIDKETGLITWKPDKAGTYRVAVVIAVTMANGTTHELEHVFSIVVKQKNSEDPKDKERCAMISGSVTFDDPINDVPSKGVVVAWRISEDANGTVKREHAVLKAEIKDGKYAMKVPAGTYKLFIEGPHFYSEWYQDVTSADEATSLEAKCDETITADFSVELKPEPKKHTVSGTVTDEESGDGLKALVTFEGTKSSSQNTRTVIKAETDAHGNYEVKLPEGVEFIASAVAIGRSNEHSLYMREFYSESSDELNAKAIKLTENMEDVNFTLSKREPTNIGFGGQVKNEEGNGIKSKVTAMQIRESNDKHDGEPDKRTSVTVETNDDGEYQFSDLTKGTYVVLATPLTKGYVGGWYVQGSTAVDSWKNATRVSVDDVMLTVQHDITLEQTKGKAGLGKARGWAVGRGVTIEQKGDVTLETLGLTGVLIVARDSDGFVSDWTLSGLNGQFELENLGIDSYTIHADRIDYLAATSTITVNSARNADVQTSMVLERVVSSVELPDPMVDVRYALFPNPATAVATIRFPSNAGTATVKIVSVTGTILSDTRHESSVGENILQVETNLLPTGIYQILVTTPDRTFALPLQVVR